MVIRHLLVDLVWAYIGAMVVFALLSWFPIEPGSGGARLQSALSSIIEPVLRPVRRLIPPVAGIDLSFMVVILVLELVIVRLLGSGGILSPSRWPDAATGVRRPARGRW